MSGSTVVVWVIMVLSCNGINNTCQYVRYDNATYAQDICETVKIALSERYPENIYKCDFIRDPNQ